MTQLSVPLTEKLDMPLAELCNGGELAPSARIPVIVRCDPETVGAISDRIPELGGSVRHQLKLLGAIAAWVPLVALSELTARHDIRGIELEQTFTIA